MTWNIKNEESCGFTREERRRDLDARVEELLAIGRRCSDALQPGPSAIEHGDLLYDDRGLPKRS